MKIRTCRMSGRPVNPADGAAFSEEWQAGYDAAEKRHTIAPVDGEGIKFQPVNMLALQEDLAALETALKAKYSIEGEVELPSTTEAWVALIKATGSPLMLANPIDKPDELVLVIMDTPLG